jgi:glyoxylase-like metal-dependent hydrolase (beta-lactamase superfamily II)
MLVVRSIAVGPFVENTYLAGCSETKKAILIDPGGETPRALALREPDGYQIVAIVCTHGHIDHVAGVAEARDALNVPSQIHEGDRDWVEALPQQAAMFGFEDTRVPQFDRFHAHGERLPVGNLEAELIHTPGHTQGGTCVHFREAGAVFVGDTLFVGSVGRTDLPGGNFPTLERSIRERIFNLGDEVRFYPGHGPSGLVGDERKSNPFVGEGRGPASRRRYC